MPGTPLVTRRIAWRGNVDGKPVDPFGTDPGAEPGTYEGDLELTITYSTNPANDAQPDPNDPRTFLEISANASGEFLTNPVQGGALWVGETVNNVTESDEENVYRSVFETINSPQTEWTLNWSQIPHQFWSQVLMTRLRERIGTINSVAMPVFYDAPIATVMFIGWSATYQYTWRDGLAGEAPVKLSMKFVEKNFIGADGVQVTWNHSYKPNVGFRRILFGPNRDRPAYKSTDLSVIFAP